MLGRWTQNTDTCGVLIMLITCTHMLTGHTANLIGLDRLLQQEIIGKDETHHMVRIN